MSSKSPGGSCKGGGRCCLPPNLFFRDAGEEEDEEKPWQPLQSRGWIYPTRLPAFLPSKTYSAKWHPLPARPDIEFCGRTNEKFFSLQTFNQVQLRHPTVLVKDFKEIILQDSTFTSRENETTQKANTLPINELNSFQQTIDKSP